MNSLRHFFITTVAPTLILLTMLGAMAHAAALGFEKSDFTSARVSPQGREALVLAKFSATGRAKGTELNSHVGEQIELSLGGQKFSFTLRDKIRGPELQVGPLDPGAARAIVDEINLR